VCNEEALLRPDHHDNRAPVAGGNYRWHQEDRIPPDQALLDEAFREGLGAIRTAAAQWDESARAGSHGADPPDHGGSPCWRIPSSHQEGSWIQELEQANPGAEAVTAITAARLRSPAGFPRRTCNRDLTPVGLTSGCEAFVQPLLIPFGECRR